MDKLTGTTAFEPPIQRGSPAKGWTLTTPETQKRVISVLLPDGVWHTVKDSSFEVVEEDNYATWIETEAFRRACPLQNIVCLTVTIIKP